MGNPDYQDEGTLRELYIDKRHSTTEIADICGCSPRTVGYWMDKHGIEARSRSESVSNAYLNDKAKEVLQDRDTLHEWYHGKRMSLTQIANEIDVSFPTVRNWMDKHGLERRSIADAKRGESFSNQQMDILGEKSELKRLYVDEKFATSEIAEMVGCSRQTVTNYLDHHGIVVRTTSEAMSGELHPRWQGGTSRHGPNWPEQRQERLEYDDYECVVCGLSQEQHKDEYGFGLHVHHIRPARKFRDATGDVNHGEANKLTNLITLCIAHHNRWEGIPLRPTQK